MKFIQSHSTDYNIIELWVIDENKGTAVYMDDRLDKDIPVTSTDIETYLKAYYKNVVKTMDDNYSFTPIKVRVIV